ncbi:DUF3592 domain-containing protein [Streptomyces macrosporus]|uniref:DUF3592 domain-containing protein n=1 Tax=Streptomyces macrosporus TaxID=44032 RepID=A0ABN3KGU6_9ACTN
MGQVLYLLGGLVFVALAVGTVREAARDRERYQRAATAVGQVVEVEVEELAEGTIHQPVVEFRAGPEGRVMRCRPPLPELARNTVKSGQRVNLRYDREDPTRTWVDGHEPEPSLMGVALWLLIAAGMLFQAFD